MRVHPVRRMAAGAHPRLIAFAVVAACALSPAASAQAPAAAAQAHADLWLAHRLSAVDAAVRGPLAGLRVAQLALVTDDAAAGRDNAHVTLTDDEARADADLRMAVAVVSPAFWDARPQALLLRVVPAPCAPLDLEPLAVTLSTDAADWARLTVRLATQPGLELDMGVLGAAPIVVRDARLLGGGGSANLSAQTDTVELEWRQARGINWASVHIGVQPQGVVAARLVASIGL